MERIANGLKMLADEFGKGAGRDDGQIAGHLKALTDMLATDEARGYAGTEKLAAQIADLKKGQDELVERTRKLERLGVANGRPTERSTYTRREARRNLAAGRVFRRDEDAAIFAALACRQLNISRPGLVSQRILDYGAELEKAGHSLSLVKTLDPGVSGSGLEFISQNVYMADLITALEAVWVMPPLCTRVPLVTTGTTTWPKLSGELTAYAVAASAAIPESEPTTTSVTLTPVKFATLTPIPNEFFRQPSMLVQLGQLMASLITRALGNKADDLLVNGDGTDSYAGFYGILNASSGLTAVTSADHNLLTEYDASDISGVVAGITKDYATDLRWFMHLSASRVIRSIVDSNGRPLYERGGNGEMNTIDGYPYTICQRFTAAASITTSTIWSAFGDLRRAILFGLLQDVQIALSDQAAFRNDQTLIRGIAHFDAAYMDTNAMVVSKTYSA